MVILSKEVVILSKAKNLDADVDWPWAGYHSGDGLIDTGDEIWDFEGIMSQNPLEWALSFGVRKNTFENGSCRQRKNW